jgi:hypothetical protein
MRALQRRQFRSTVVYDRLPALGNHQLLIRALRLQRGASQRRIRKYRASAPVRLGGSTGHDRQGFWSIIVTGRQHEDGLGMSLKLNLLAIADARAIGIDPDTYARHRALRAAKARSSVCLSRRRSTCLSP